MNKPVSTLIVALALALTLAACGKDAPSAPPAAAPPAAPPTAPPAPPPADAAQPAFVAAYEALRVALVNDDPAATRATAEALAAAAADHAPIAEAARDVAAASDLEEARLAFGEASRAYLTLIAADPGLAKGKHAFRCPMAKGYMKWVQLTDGIDNPYMGQRMLACGGPTDLAP